MRSSIESPRHLNYLKRGKGGGGSPTRFDVQETDTKELRFAKRHPSIASYRLRNNNGSYSMIGGESTQLLQGPRILPDLEQRKHIQEQIASYREIKYQREQERLHNEADQVQQQR